MPRKKIIDVEKTIDKRVRKEFQTMHRKTLDKHVFALATSHKDTLTLLAVSLAPTRETAEEDFARVMGTIYGDDGIMIKIPFWFASNRLGDVPVIVAGVKEYV